MNECQPPTPKGTRRKTKKLLITGKNKRTKQKQTIPIKKSKGRRKLRRLHSKKAFTKQMNPLKIEKSKPKSKPKKAATRNP